MKSLTNEEIRKKRAVPVVKKSALTEFIVEINSKCGYMMSGKITHKETGETFLFTDINEMINIIQRKHDNMFYPQTQNKLREWANNEYGGKDKHER